MAGFYGNFMNYPGLWGQPPQAQPDASGNQWQWGNGLLGSGFMNNLVNLRATMNNQQSNRNDPSAFGNMLFAARMRSRQPGNPFNRLGQGFVAPITGYADVPKPTGIDQNTRGHLVLPTKSQSGRYL